MTTSGDPPRDLPVEAEVEHGRPRRSVVNIRPWLLETAVPAGPGPRAARRLPRHRHRADRDQTPAPAATRRRPPRPDDSGRSPKATEVIGRKSTDRRHRRRRPLRRTPATSGSTSRTPDARPAAPAGGPSLEPGRDAPRMRPSPEDDLDLKPTAMRRPEPLYGYVVGLELIFISILNLTVTHGKGAPAHPATA